MTTTFVDFQPSSLSNFQFQAILDGNSYNIVVTWNMYGLRYYVNIYTTSGTLVLCKPLIGSPLGYDISITKGYFTSTLVFRDQNQQFEISDAPLTYPNFGARNQYMLDIYGNPIILGTLAIIG